LTLTNRLLFMTSKKRRNSIVIPKKISKKLRRRIVHSSLRFHYRFRKYKDVVWIVGDARSGTTWLSRLINHKKKYREMFEPFHPHFVKEMDFLSMHQYLRPHDSHPQLEKAAADVFSGKLIHRRIDSANNSFFTMGY